MFQTAVAALQSKLPFLICGAVGGYILMLCTNPVRSSLRDGLRAIRRYPAIWLTLGAFGFAYAIFNLAVQVYFATHLPPGERPEFVWMREGWRDPELWLAGSPESLWWLPRADFDAVLRDARLPALESLAGLFNWLVETFPFSALAALLLFVNWEGHHGVLWRALRKRFGALSPVVHFGILLCALAALMKPLMYVAPHWLHAREVPSETLAAWMQWLPVAEWLAFLFEYLFGVCIQVYLILLGYVWVRGLTFTREHLLDFAIRRFSFVVKWAAVIMLLSTLIINVPLILKNFEPFAAHFPEEEVLQRMLPNARAALALFILLGASVQTTLTFHSESLRKALRDHVRFVMRNWWPFAWFLIIAALHFYLLHVLNLSMVRGLGEGAAPAVAWSLCFPWVAGVLGAWLLASWVCVFKRCETGRAQSDNWMRF